MIEFYSHLFKQTTECLLYFTKFFLQNLTDANEEYQKQIQNMRAEIEDAVGQYEKFAGDNDKLNVRGHKKFILTNPYIKP